jgi:6-pyruvoyl-tetrahydropterin synthase
MMTYIVVRTQFEATHCWPECPIEAVAFLKHPHRHMFHVTVKWNVSHGNRELEFIVAKRKVQQFLESFNGDLGSRSCEHLCEILLEEFMTASYASVFEDGENGAEIFRTPTAL